MYIPTENMRYLKFLKNVLIPDYISVVAESCNQCNQEINPKCNLSYKLLL